MLFIYDLSEDKSGFDGLIIDTVFLGTGNSLQGVRGHTFLCTRKCHFWQAYIYSYSFLRKKMQWKDQQRPTLRWGGAHHFMQRWEQNHWELRGGKFGSVSSRPPTSSLVCSFYVFLHLTNGSNIAASTLARKRNRLPCRLSDYENEGGKLLDKCQYLGNRPPTPPLTQH